MELLHVEPRTLDRQGGSMTPAEKLAEARRLAEEAAHDIAQAETVIASAKALRNAPPTTNREILDRIALLLASLRGDMDAEADGCRYTVSTCLATVEQIQRIAESFGKPISHTYYDGAGREPPFWIDSVDYYTRHCTFHWQASRAATDAEVAERQTKTAAQRAEVRP
jgi:hypothetical protein